jgi:cytochrome c-type biogenesis protein
VGYNRYLIARTLSFILGFSAVFIFLSMLLATTFSLMGGVARYIKGAAGIIVIILGLNIIFDFLAFLNYEKRFHLSKRPRGIAGAFLAGAAFGAGWTPCVGPILGSILLLAGQSGTTGTAVLYLGAYSIGLGLPFLGAAIFFNHFLKYVLRLGPLLPRIRQISGMLLMVIGTLILTGRFQNLNILIIKGQYRFIQWADSGTPLVRLLPAGILLLAALLPLIRLLQKKPIRRMRIILPSGLFGVLSILQLTGSLDCAGFLARWLVYLQNL